MKAKSEEDESGQSLPSAPHSHLRQDPKLVPASHCSVKKQQPPWDLFLSLGHSEVAVTNGYSTFSSLYCPVGLTVPGTVLWGCPSTLWHCAR